MTTKEALEVLKGLPIVRYERISNHKSTVCEALLTAIKTLENAEKYRWHDLRKNPEDLPKPDDAYIVCWVINGYDKRYYEMLEYYEDGFEFAPQMQACLPFGRAEVIAWREIEPFESEEE